MAETALNNSVHAASGRAVSRGKVGVLVVVAIVVRIAVMSIWPPRAFSCDMKDWRIIAGAMTVGLNPFDQHYGPLLNWPPMWMEILYFLARISDRLDWQFFTSLRLFLIAADAILIASTWRLCRMLGEGRASFGAMLLGLCVNPFLVLMTIQQGNFDVVPTIGVVWFIYFLIRFERNDDPMDWLCSALCLGLAVFAKTFPLVLLPLLIGPSRRVSSKGKVLGAALCAGPAMLSLAPLFVLYPREIIDNVILYRGTSGPMGASGILQLIGGPAALSSYAPFFTLSLILAVAILAGILWSRPLRRESDYVLLAAILLLGVFEFGSGYGPQYWMWVAPLLVVSYVHQSKGFGRLLLVCAAVVVGTNILFFAYNSDLGSFMTSWSGTAATLRLRQAFSIGTHDPVLICLPMSAAALLIWISCCREILRSKPVGTSSRG